MKRKDRVLFGVLAAYLDAAEERAGRAWGKAHPDASDNDYAAALPISREGRLYDWVQRRGDAVEQAIADAQAAAYFKLAWREAPAALVELPEALKNIDGITPRMLEAIGAAVRKRAQEVAHGT